MKIFLYSHGSRESQLIATLDMDVAPATGDEVDILGIGQFIVRSRKWDVMRVAPAWEVDQVRTLSGLSLYVQSVEAFQRELAQVEAEGA